MLFSSLRWGAELQAEGELSEKKTLKKLFSCKQKVSAHVWIQRKQHSLGTPKITAPAVSDIAGTSPTSRMPGTPRSPLCELKSFFSNHNPRKERKSPAR